MGIVDVLQDHYQLTAELGNAVGAGPWLGQLESSALWKLANPKEDLVTSHIVCLITATVRGPAIGLLHLLLGLSNHCPGLL